MIGSHDLIGMQLLFISHVDIESENKSIYAWLLVISDFSAKSCLFPLWLLIHQVGFVFTSWTITFILYLVLDTIWLETYFVLSPM